MSAREFASVAQTYHAWVSSRLRLMDGNLNLLQADLTVADIDSARSRWRAAHLIYETLGPASDAFGEWGPALNATLVDAHSSDPRSSGFHRVEELLWTAAPMVELKEAVGMLRRSAARGRQAFIGADCDPLVTMNRMPQIVEAAIHLELSGRSDAGSHTGLATIAANLYGVSKVLGLFEPVLQVPYPTMAGVMAVVGESEALMHTYRRGGQWCPVQALRPTERDRIARRLGRLVNALAEIARTHG